MITHQQALRSGLSQDAIDRRIRSGRWLRCARSVYFVADRQFTDTARIRAAVLTYGAQACASGIAAAWWHGLTKFPPHVVEVTIPRNSRLMQRPGTRLRRRDLYPRDIVDRDGLRLTSSPQ